MKIEINIPKEFEKEYLENKFKDTFDRFMGDIHFGEATDGSYLVGNYEYETLKMLSEAFANSKETKGLGSND